MNLAKEVTRASLSLTFEELGQELKTIESKEKLSIIEQYIIYLQDFIEDEILTKKRRNSTY